MGDIRRFGVSISNRVRESLAGGSLIRKVWEDGFNLKQQYGEENVFDLALGNPIMEPPVEFHRELKRLVENPLPGMHRYMPNAGYPETRAAVAAQLSLETGIKFTLDDIVMTCGAAGALNITIKTILNPGDEVIVFAPYFIQQLGELLDKKGTQYETCIFLISDEPYRKIIYDGGKCPYVWPHYRQSIVATSYSKDLSLPGERIGYVAVHPDCSDREELIGGLIYCNRTLYTNAPALMQHVVRHLQTVTVPIAEYQRKRDFLFDHLNEMGYSVVKPQGAFYMFPKLPLEDETPFTRELQQWRVLTVPGRGFGLPGYFRISYCVDDRTLESSLEGFQKAAKKFNLC